MVTSLLFPGPKTKFEKISNNPGVGISLGWLFYQPFEIPIPELIIYLFRFIKLPQMGQLGWNCRVSQVAQSAYFASGPKI